MRYFQKTTEYFPSLQEGCDRYGCSRPTQTHRRVLNDIVPPTSVHDIINLEATKGPLRVEWQLVPPDNLLGVGTSEL